MKRVNVFIFTLLMVLAAGFYGCNQEPVEVHYGADECAHCRMMITDDRFATQIITEKGKAYKFDAIECMVAFNRDSKERLKNSAFWVSNYENGGKWINGFSAVFVKSEVINSPMGASLLALPDSSAAKEHLSEKPGKAMDWENLIQSNISL